MPVVTGTQIVTDALLEIGFLQEGESPSAQTLSDSLRRLNYMVSRWAIEGLSLPTLARVTFPLLAGKGGASNPYTIGIGQDINVPRPPRQVDITGAGLILTASTNTNSGALEIIRSVMTDDGWEGQRLKDLTNVLFTGIYYRPDCTNDVGHIFLWPIPTDLTNVGVLYIQNAITPFVDGPTQVSVPTGADEALYLGLAAKLVRPLGRPDDEGLRVDAGLAF